MKPAPSHFYVTGGTVARESLSYVRRNADEQLYRALLAGEFCYILTPRQMGKSSLMTHTARRLQEVGANVAVIDLSSIGSNLDEGQWVNDLLDHLGYRLKLEDELEEWVVANGRLSPLQRWQRALRAVVLPHTTGQVIIFLDEIDIVRSLPFSTDEFFAAIRACYNARAEESDYRRLTFCLLGVATPAELIQNPLLTPFNIGTRIELRDFTPDEAAQLRLGLRPKQSANHALVQRIYFWTGGHPCLTQRLFKAVAENDTILTPNGVDNCCRRLFLAPTAETRDDNLQFVQQRLLPDGEEERAALLTLYTQVWEGKPVEDNDTLATITQLKLSGVALVREGNGLQVRNRTYRQVFDRAWIAEHMPGAERRRQKQAYRHGVLRAALVFTALLIVVSSLALLAGLERRQAQRSAHTAQKAAHDLRITNDKLEASEQNNRLNLYVADMYQAQQYWEQGNVAGVQRLLASHYPEQDGRDLRGFEWSYLWAQLHQAQQTLKGHKGIVFSMAYSHDGVTVATGGWDRTPILWNSRTGQATRMRPQEGIVSALAFSPHDNILATASTTPSHSKNIIRLWDPTTLTLLDEFPVAGNFTQCLAFSHKGNLLAVICSADHGPYHVYLWSVPEHRILATVPLASNSVDGNCLAFSPDDRLLYMPGNDSFVCVWDKVSQKIIKQFLSLPNMVRCLCLSAKGDYLAGGDGHGNIFLYTTSNRQLVHTYSVCTEDVHSIAFSPDGSSLLAGDWEGNVHLCSVPDGRRHFTLAGHSDRVNTVAFSPDGKTIASVSSDSTVKLWNLADFTEPTPLPLRKQSLLDAFISPTGNIVAMITPGTGGRDASHAKLRLWDTATWKEIPLKIDSAADLRSNHGGRVALAPDKHTVALARAGSSRIQIKDVLPDGTVKSMPDSIQVPKVPGKITFSPDSSRLAISEDVNNTIQVWDRKTNSSDLIFQSSEQRAISSNHIKFSPDNRFSVFNWKAAGKNYMRLWDVEHRRVVSDLTGMRDIVTDSAFSADSRYLAVSDWDGAIIVWDLTTVQEVKRFRAYRSYATALAFAPDGRTLATGDENDDIKLWNTATWREVAHFPGTKGHRVWWCAFTPDGTQLLSATDQGIRMWKADTPAEIEAREQQEGRLEFLP